MKHIKKYIDHSNIDKIQWIKVKPVKSAVESKKLKELIKLATEELYQVFYLGDPFNKKLDKTRPILKYGLNEILLHTLLSFNKLKDSEYYNKSVEGMKSADKKSWHEMLGEKDYLPLTVTDAKDVKKLKLKFPIICKPAEGHSGLGIMKFDSFEEFEKEISKPECELDTFSEMVKDIDTEYRFVFCKNDLFLAHERIAIKEENKTISTKKADEELRFLYVEQDLEKFKDKDKIDDILFDFKKYVDLDFFALDVLLDKRGKYWLIESNSNIGMGGNTLARAYEAIYKDYYKKDVPENKQQIIDKICKEYYEEILKLYPEEIKDSKIPMIYGSSTNESNLFEMDRREAEQEAALDAYGELWGRMQDFPEYKEKHWKGDLNFQNTFDIAEENLEDGSEVINMPEIIDGDYNCSFNVYITELYGGHTIPSKKIGGNFDFQECKVTSFEGITPEIGGDIIGQYNELESLEHSPKKVNGTFDVIGNPIKNLEYCPEIIMGDFLIFGDNDDINHLISLPKYIKGNFDINEHPTWKLTKKDLYKGNKLKSEKEIDELILKKKYAKLALAPLSSKYKSTSKSIRDFGFFEDYGDQTYSQYFSDRSPSERRAAAARYDIEQKLEDRNLPTQDQKIYKGDLDISGVFDILYEYETEDLSFEDIIADFIHMPEVVTGHYVCEGSDSSMYGLEVEYFMPTKEVKKDLLASSCHMDSLESLTPNIGGDIDIGFNKLKNLIGSQDKVNGDFDAAGNEFESLEGCPSIIMGDFNVFRTHKKTLLVSKDFTLKELPKYIKGKFDIDFVKEWNLTKEDLYKKNKLKSDIEIDELVNGNVILYTLLKDLCSKNYRKKFKGTSKTIKDFGFFED